MRYKEFGRTGMKVSALTVGTWAIGGANWGDVDREQSVAAIHAMLDDGVNFVDTAPVYNAGHSEQVVGEALEGRRSQIFLATKTALYNDPVTGEAIKDGRRDTILRLCEESLKNLRTDYFDVYILHWPVPGQPVKESMETMMELKAQGVIRHIGVSNYSREQILEAQQYGEVELIQPPYSMVNRSQEELIRWAADQGLGVMSYASLGAGILTGSIRSMPDFAPTDIRMTFYDFFREPKFSRTMELLHTLDQVAAAHGAPVPQVALNWSTQKAFIDTAIIGVRNPAEAHENCNGFGWSLTEEEMERIDAAIEATVGR